MNQPTCACGCGQPVTPDDRGRPRRYLRNHHRTGVKQSPETVAKRAASLKVAWADPTKMVTMRHQSPELIEQRTAKIRGRKLSPERIAIQTAAVKAAWVAGKYRNVTGASAEHMARIHKLVDMTKLIAANSVRMANQVNEWKTTGQLEAIRRKAGNATGMPDHICAKQWNIRDPNGYTHTFSNLSEWARQNQSRFEDCAPASRLPHWKRIAGGIRDILSKQYSCSYQGWVAVSKTELETGAPDPLNRTE